MSIYLKDNKELMKEYNYQKNTNLDLDALTVGSKKRIFWMCEKKHEWEANICDRFRGNGCPYCSNQKVLKGYNDLESNNPDLAKEWNYEKNNGLFPNEVPYGSNMKVWWKCDKGHEWEAQINSRNKGRKCPYCTNQKVLKGYNDFGTFYSDLLEEWNYEKNKNYTPYNVSRASTIKVWWKCKRGHEWECSVYKRVKGSKCPYCQGRKVLKGYNDLATVRKDLIKEWSNSNKKHPSEYYYNSPIVVEWICKKGHHYNTSIKSRNTLNVGCPYCTNQKVLKGYNDLATLNPNLAKYWNYEKNGERKPSEVINGGTTKWWWKCDKGHEWQSIIRKESDLFCPYCFNRKLLTGFNDLKTMCPDICNQFDEKKNNITPDKVLYSLGNKQYWWKCNLNHSYSASIRNKTILKSGCPYCSNQKTLTGYNDILSHKEYSDEWNYEKNIGIDPSTVNYHSMKKYWWKCKKGHEWRISPYGKKGCPFCNKEKKTSLPEKIIYFYVKKYFDNALDNFSPVGLGQKNIDIYIPDLKVGIEYDGGHYHRNINTDIKKDSLCNKLGIKLYRVREYNCPILNSSSICLSLKDNSYDELTRIIILLLKKLSIVDSTVNINADLDKIYDLIDYSEKQNSLSERYPDLLKEWDFEKNGKLTPDLVGAKSTKIVWWKCDKGHSYQSKVEDKTHKGNKCPICANRRVLKGYNDLESNNPDLAKEWNYEKNGGLVPSQVLYGGIKKYWWICEKGHEWETSIKVRMRGCGCPICNNKIILKGFNDLETTNPKLAKEWNYEKNKGLKPFDIMEGSGKKVWWKCKKGHEWEASPNNRSRGRGCPKCYIEK